MRMSLDEIIEQLIYNKKHTIKEEEIVNSIKVLLDDSICEETSTIIKVYQMVKSIYDYEMAILKEYGE
jgi:DNA-directed RNA polymerase delta subunit